MQSKMYYSIGSSIPLVLVASVLIGFTTLSTLMVTNFSSRDAAMTIEPTSLTTVPGETFDVAVLVSSALPVNAFTGILSFDSTVLSIDHISYNMSIADLWTEEPWFSQGTGTVTFTGGTTRTGGFTGTDVLITVTFKASTPGNAKLQLSAVRILQHDGLGTDAPLATPIDTLFTVATATPLSHTPTATTVTVLPTYESTDLNTDGYTSISDISIFLLYLTTGDTRGDVNGDKNVNMSDFSIILDART